MVLEPFRGRTMERVGRWALGVDWEPLGNAPNRIAGEVTDSNIGCPVSGKAWPPPSSKKTARTDSWLVSEGVCQATAHGRRVLQSGIHAERCAPNLFGRPR